MKKRDPQWWITTVGGIAAATATAVAQSGAVNPAVSSQILTGVGVVAAVLGVLFPARPSK